MFDVSQTRRPASHGLQVTNNMKATTIDLKIFGIAELAVTIIAVSIPILRVFIRRSYRKNVTRTSFVRLRNRSSISHQGSSAYTGGSRGSRVSRTNSIPMKIRVTETVEVHHAPKSDGYYGAYHGPKSNNCHGADQGPRSDEYYGAYHEPRSNEYYGADHGPKSNEYDGPWPLGGGRI